MAKANTNKTFFSIIFLLTIYYYVYTCPNYDALSDNLERNRIAKLGKGMEQAKFFADFFQLDVASQKLANELIINVLHKTQHKCSNEKPKGAQKCLAPLRQLVHTVPGTVCFLL